MAPRYVLGISAYYHDSAACLLRDGAIVAAAQEERFTRKKGDAAFPLQATRYCLAAGGITPADLAYVGFYDKPLIKFERILETYLGVAPRGFGQFRMAGPLWMKEKLFLDREIRRALAYDGEILYAEHHESHAASAFFPSPFEQAAILTIDGVGEWATAALGVGRGNDLELLKELQWPDSLGLLYSAFTDFTGFRVNSGEYKVMGLAPYGEPRFTKIIFDHLIDLKEDGSFRLNQTYFDYCTGLKMTNDGFAGLFGVPARKPEDRLEQIHMDLAASIQSVTEEAILRLTRSLAAETGARNLCLAGGVALNCVANGKVLRDNRFENVWIQPAAGDAGGSLGAALAAYHLELNGSRHPSNEMDGMAGGYLGPAFDDDEVRERLITVGASFAYLENDDLLDRTAGALASEKAVGWFQGRMEFGPRALGARSILADPRSPTMQRILNLKVKYRESFRPFAPSVLREDVDEWFDLDVDSPYMLLVAEVAERHRRSVGDAEPSLFGIDKLN